MFILSHIFTPLYISLEDRRLICLVYSIIIYPALASSNPAKALEVLVLALPANTPG
jgi:hypothetical protein